MDSQKSSIKKTTLLTILGSVLFLLLAIFAIRTTTHFFSPTKVNKSIIGEYTVTQLTATVGESIKWVKAVPASSISDTRHLVEVPKIANKIKISTSSQNNLASSQNSKLTNTDRKKLAELSKQRADSTSTLALFASIKKAQAQKIADKNLGFFGRIFQTLSKIRSNMFATVEEAVSDTSEAVPETTIIDVAPIVDQPSADDVSSTNSDLPDQTQDQNILIDSSSAEVSTTSEIISDSTNASSATSSDENISITDSTSSEEVNTSTSSPDASSTDSIDTPKNNASSTDVVQIEYETPAPEISEADTNTGKVVTVSATDTPDTTITNVLAFTDIPEIFKVGDEDNIQIKWSNNDDKDVSFHAYDLDHNGYLDYVEWTVPHLSTQTFEIIFISKAFKLNAQKHIVADIYDKVSAQDGVWSSVNDAQYVRVTFQNKLTNLDDIVLYARPKSPNNNSKVEIYPVYEDENGNQTSGDSPIATIDNITHSATYKTLIPNLETPTDVFDLKIIGNIEIDYIVDPNCTTATDDSTYTVCTYTANGTFVTPSGVTTAWVLVVAGGAGGRWDSGGGGGAGGVISSTSMSISGSQTITVGAGGAAGDSSSGNTNGANSSIGSLAVAIGGGGGAIRNNTPGSTGGSGGGAGTCAGLCSGGAGTSGQGNSGGTNGSFGSPYPGGGGGGAGAAGQNAPDITHPGNGGNGFASSISGSSVTYGGGGGASAFFAGFTQSSGGTGGGGAGGAVNGAGTNGTTNTGGGGGAGCGNGNGSGSQNGGAGGSGIVIIRYVTPSPTTFTWNGAGADNNWSTAGNWVGGVAPVPGSSLIFIGSTRTSPNNDFANNTRFGTIQIASTSFTLSGNSVDLTGGNLTVDTLTSGTVTVSLIATGTGSVIMNANGGTLILSGVNTFSGGVTIQAGTVQANTSASALGTATTTIGNTTGSAAASLLVGTTGLTFSNKIVLATNASVGTLTIGNSGTAISTTFSGGVTGTNNFTINSGGTSGTIAFSTAVINNSGTVTHIGAGSGTVTISAAIGANITGITQNTTTSSLTVSGAITVNTATTTLTLTAGTVAFSGGVTGTGNLVVTQNSNTVNSLGLHTTAVNNTGTVTFNGTGTGQINSSTLNEFGSNVTQMIMNIPGGQLALQTAGAGTFGQMIIKAGTLNCGVTCGGVGTITLGDTTGSQDATIWDGSNSTNIISNAIILASGNTGTMTIKNGNTNLTITTYTGGITGTHNLTIDSNESSGGSLTFATGSVNISGVVTHIGTATSTLTISGGVGSNVTGITQNTTTSPLTISTTALTVASGGTTLTNSSTAAFTVSGGVTGTGNLILNNNSTTAAGITLTTTSVNNSGTITNSGTGSGSVTITGGVGANVTGVTENTTTSALTISTTALTVASGGTTLTNTAGTALLTISGGVGGTGNLILNNNSTLASGISITTTSLNNTGTVTNSGSGTGDSLVSAVIGTAVTGVVENSTTSPLSLSAANTFTTGLTIKSGSVKGQTSNNAFGANNSTITIGDTTGSAAASLLAVSSGRTFANPIVLATNSNNPILTIGNSGVGITATFSGGVTGTNNLTIDEEGGTGTITFSNMPINNAGTVTNIGAGTGLTTISGGIGTNVTAVSLKTTSSALTISTNPITVASGGTTLTNASGTAVMTVSGGVTGVGNLIVNNNSSTANGVTFSTGVIDNIGTVTNSGTGAGTETITGTLLGINITSLIENSSTSGLTLSGATTLTGGLTITSGTFTAPAANFTINGNFSNSGTFTHNSGTVIFNGANQSITGATTFYNAKFSTSTAITDGTGGTITHDNGYTVHSFTSSGTFTAPTGSLLAETLVVAGGGGSSFFVSGGGGAGGYIASTSYPLSGSITVTVGAGGAGGNNSPSRLGSQGSNSVFGNITATGGGYGADQNSTEIGGNGGSGGGGTINSAGGSASSGQGNAGGSGGGNYAAGGGGGAGVAGSNAVNSSTGGAGGNGKPNSISGTTAYYAGGGGGFGYPDGLGGAGGLGGGGASGVSAGVSGTANTGGGGGGTQAHTGGSGGSGIVIVRYLTPASYVGTTLSSAITVANNLTIDPSATLIAGSNSITLAGNWANSGTFTANTSTTTFNGATTVSGSSVTTFNNINITGTLTAPSSANMNVAGNWTNSGTFTHNSGTVTLNGGNQTITGNSTFYNLTKSTSSAPTLTFAAGSTSTIASGGTITLAGTSGHLLSLRSGSTPTRWNLAVNAGATQAVSYVDVMDSDASGGAAIAQTNSTDSGHNLNWLFDATPPTITLATLSPYFATSTVTASGTSTDTGNVTNVQYQMDGTGGSWSSCTANDASFNGTSEPFTCAATSLSEGSHTIYIRSTDGYSNTTSNANAASSTFTVDTIAPSVNAGTDKTSSTTVSQNATASDVTSGIASYLWSKVSGPGTLSFSATTSEDTNISTNADGSYVIRLTVTDNAGNANTDDMVLTWDTTAPVTSDDYGSRDGNWQNTSPQSIILTPSDALSGLSFTKYCTDSVNSCDTTTGTSYTSAVPISSEGITYFRYASRDGAGNTQTTVSRMVKIDTVNPSVSAGTDTTASSTFSQNATASDGTSGIASYLWSKVSGPGTVHFSATTSEDTTISTSADGSYVVRSTVTDNAGNANTDDMVLTWDTTGPVVTDDVPSSWQTSNFDITLTCNDATTACSKVFYTTDGTTPTTASPYVNTSSSYAFTQSTEGDFVLKYRGQDTVGNLESTQTATNDIRLDKTVPSVSVTAPSDNSTVSGISVTVSATATDTISSVAGVQFKLDDTMDIGSEDISSPYSISFDTTGVADGPHTITAVATDNAGNVATSSTINITVDNTAPSRSNGNPSGTQPINTTNTVISLDTGENATCKYSTSSSTPYGSMTVFTGTGVTIHTTSVSGLANGGSYNYYITCQDGQGNTNDTLFTISFNVQADVTAPTVDVTAPLNNAIVSGSSLSITADATDDVSVSGVQFKLDTNTNIGSEDTAGPYATTLDTTALIDGYHAIIAVAHDGTGNYSTSSTINVQVDNTAPIVDAGTDKIKNSLFTQNASTTDVTSGIASYLWSKVSGPGTITFGTASAEDTTISANTDGNYVIKLLVTDNAGNSASSTFALTWDTTDPTVNAGTDTTASSTFSQNATASDGTSGIASYLWSKVSGPGTVHFSATTSEDTTISTSADGSYVVRSTVTDNAGNANTDDMVLTWDTTGPVVTDDVPSSWQTSNFDITLTCNDATTACSKVFYTTDGSTPSTGSSYVDSGSGFVFTQSTEGDLTLKYKGQDILGNLESVQTAINDIQLDKTAPTVTDDVPSSWQVNDITITLTCDDTAGGDSGCSKVYYTTDGSTPTTGSAYVDSSTNFQFTQSTEGDFTLKYRGIDVAGNLESTQTGLNNIRLDKTPPNVTNIAPIDGSLINRTGQLMTFSLNEFGDCRVSTVQRSYDQMANDTICTTNNGLQISCTLPTLTSGAKDIYIACEDTIGNKDTAFSGVHMIYHVPGTHQTVSVSSGSGANVYSMKINGGSGSANTRIVSIDFTESAGSDATAIVLSTDPDFSHAMIIPYQNSYSFDLCSGQLSCPDNAYYTVYAKFLNPQGIAYPVISSQIYLNEVSLITEVTSSTGEIITSIASTTSEIINAILPPEEKVAVVFPPIEESVPETPQYVFLGEWQLSISSLLNSFVFSALPNDFKSVVAKFPDITDILAKVGITKLNDLEKLTTTQISLPGLAEAAGLNNGSFALADFSKSQSNKIPTDIVFVRTADESVDLNVKLSISNEGLALQKVNTIQGKALSFVVKPEQPAKSIDGYLIFKSGTKNAVSVRNAPKNSLVATVAEASEMSAQNIANLDDGPDLVLSKFAYKENANGVWTAEVASPQVLGNYELRTVVNFKNTAKASEKISMIVVVDPEGYVYEKLSDGREIRLNHALVSIYWQNPETKNYELWPAKSFRQENPQTTDVTGRYSFLVPEGMYYLTAHLDSYGDYKSDPFKVEESKGVFMNIELRTKWWLSLFTIQNTLLVAILAVLAYMAVIFTKRRKSNLDGVFFNK